MEQQMRASIPQAPFLRPGGSRSESGIALVLVLGMLALIVILMVAFLGSVSSELKSAKTYASGLDAKSLADSSVNIVISQIQDATAQPRLAWASQPGMIRTYDDAGAPVAAYKLYSSDRLRVDGAFNPLASLDTEIPADWADRRELFADLNKPVSVGGANRYPIINPSAVGKDASGAAALEGTEPAIEGCYLDTTKPAVAVSANQPNPVPMPVRWLYVLKDGRITQMNESSGKVNGASKNNPIVGRMAFWTDDESSKVNVNTASEGTFWDRPWTMGVGSGGMTGSPPNKTSPNYEERLALNMPAQNEFQRYPGHPAMTSLSTIFPPFTGESTVAYNKRIYGIIPRVNDKDASGVDAGSQSGTKNVNLSNQNKQAIQPDKDRLFASVDEFLFQITDNVASANPRKANLKAPATEFSENDLDRTRFFLTATSRTPEVNLFNKPRITLWPLQLDPDPESGLAVRNSKDKLIAFCSTIGGKPYYFQRYNTYTSLTQDPMPSSQSPLMDFYLSKNVSSPPSSPSRNQELYAYLQSLTGSPIPGLGGSFLQKYPESRDQILTEMFDFVRSSVNTFSSGDNPKYYFTPFNPSGFITGQSQIVPAALPNGTKGFGRFSTITEAALVFYRMDKLKYKLLDASGLPTGNAMDVPDVTTYLVEQKVVVYENTPPPDPEVPINIGAVVLLEPFNPTPGPPPWTGHVQYVIKGLDGLSITGAAVLEPFPARAVNKVAAFDNTNNATSQTGLEQYLQYRDSASGKFSSPKTLGLDDPEKKYAFFAHFTLPPGTTTMSFTGGAITIEIYPGSATVLDDSTLVQTIVMNFPGVPGLPVPSVIYTNAYGKFTDPVSGEIKNRTTLKGENWRSDFNNRISFLNNFPYQNPPAGHNGRYGIAEDWDIKPANRTPHGPLPLVMHSTTGPRGDIVRSAEARYGGAAQGDYRVYAGLKNVPETFFEGHGIRDAAKGTPPASRRLYADTSAVSRLVHSLTIDGMSGSADTTNQNGYYAGAGAGGGIDPRGVMLPGVPFSDTARGDNTRKRKAPVVPRGLAGAYLSNGALGDWDNGPGAQVDGPFINPADQTAANNLAITTSLYYTTGGYINGAGVIESGSSFSPNRQISSAVAFGSLPTGINPSNPDSSKPWQTLLFTKHPLAGASHPGFGSPVAGPPYGPSGPPDHAFLDLFTMPIVEPYAISEPFSTAGKVNMNYQIVPFTYLTRNTGVRAVLKATQMMAIPNSTSMTYKLTNTDPDSRYTLNPDEQTGTLKGFQMRFDAGDIFRSASEICGISLVPQYRVGTTTPAPGSPTYASMGTWWNDYQITGDNVREQPYGHIYPRLTTKSNTYTVHVMTQSLKKNNVTPVDEFSETRDQVTGEYRGSFIIERYLDPNADSLVKADGKTPASETDPDGMVGPYKFRVISSKRFAP